MPSRNPELAPLLPAIDGLEVVRLLGRGGMGEVYLAHDHRRRQPVAVKVIAPGNDTPDARARFSREVEALRTIRHPSVLRLLEAGEASAVPYAIFERVHGHSLDRLEGAQPWPRVISIAWQLARAIDAVHEAGFLHRDIKHGNVMLGHRGLVTLIDFGLAKRHGAPDLGFAQGSSPPSDPSHTGDGMVVGTPRFLAPEIRRGRPASVQSDIFALGIVMRELIEGGNGEPAALDDPTRRARYLEAPLELTELVARCLAHDRAERPASAGEVAAALERLSPASSRLTLATRWRGGHAVEAKTWTAAVAGAAA